MPRFVMDTVMGVQSAGRLLRDYHAQSARTASLKNALTPHGGMSWRCPSGRTKTLSCPPGTTARDAACLVAIQPRGSAIFPIELVR